MLIFRPDEIDDLVEYVYNEEGRIVGEKISESATPEQRKIFEQYQRDYEEMKRRSFSIDLSDRTYNPMDGWKMK